MRRFAALYVELDASTAAADQVAAMLCYFAQAPPEDAAWAVYFLAGGRPRQTVPAALLRGTACREACLADWLFDECLGAVGDLAETIAHVLPPAAQPSDLSLADWAGQRLPSLKGLPPERTSEQLAHWWRELDWAGRFVLTRLIGGGFRAGVSLPRVQQALADHVGLDPKRVAERMVGYTGARAVPTAQRYGQLLARAGEAVADTGQPYPFFPAQELDLPPDEFPSRLGPVADWLVEWMHHGLRAQIVKRAGQVWIWSRGDELVTERFPDVAAQALAWPDGSVLDGHLLAWPAQGSGSLALLQQRIGRKTVTKKLLAEVPVVFMAHDLLELAGRDLRARPQHERRAALLEWAAGTALRVSPEVAATDWPALTALHAQARGRGANGLMLKHRQSAYGCGRANDAGEDDPAGQTWWQWKAETLRVHGVLIYAQAGHGRHASGYTDYTFAVWSRTPADAAEAQAVVDAIEQREPARPGALQLVPVAKACPGSGAGLDAGLDDIALRAVDGVIRATTVESFGPVRSVKPTLVVELGFEGIHRSARHKSGLALRGPRMLRLRQDTPLHEADTLQRLQALLG